MNESGPEYIEYSEKKRPIMLCAGEKSGWSKSKKTRRPINEIFEDSIFSSPTVLFSIFSLIVSIIFAFL